MRNDLIRLRLAQAISLVGPLTTLIVNPWSNFDPISVVKMLALSTIAFFISSILIVGKRSIDWAKQRLLLTASISFVSWMILVILFSGAPLNQQIWGTFGRNTGFITYLSLIFILIGAAVLADKGSYKKIVDSLLWVSLPMTLYCLVQVSGNDPIGWSYKSTFGTLGNVNFLSAFMGMVSVVALSYAIANVKKNPSLAISLLSLIVIDIGLVLSTNSIQGVMIFGAGSAVIVFFWLRTTRKFKLFQSGYVAVVTIISVPVIGGIFNQGPLGKYLFQNSTRLRGDYIHAGWEMTLRFPLFGVGMDSYGDWYREVRGKISTEAGIDRVANTAHNIFLDVSSNGGFPLLFAYLLLLGLAARAAFRVYRSKGDKYDPVFVAIFSAWFAYQVQALISINQIGVGVWGWIFTGSLIGYEQALSQSDVDQARRKRLKGQLLPAGAGLLSMVGILIGFLVAWFPVSADARYMASLKSRSLETITKSSRVLGSTAWHSEMALDTAMRVPAPPQALQIAKYIVSKYPRDNFGWKVILLSELSTPEEKAQALSNLRKLDPYYPQWRN